ncbi:unnamed protein product [Trichogramma brassicae]|uniref:Uncharacterized protein n=1 Tax=Trichogramma brassicae TaxID=86971 RepID=A0A6H5HXT1_9HYME|nr:unnamed protein product [Trichogramma brassicae]
MSISRFYSITVHLCVQMVLWQISHSKRLLRIVYRLYFPVENSCMDFLGDQLRGIDADRDGLCVGKYRRASVESTSIPRGQFINSRGKIILSCRVFASLSTWTFLDDPRGYFGHRKNEKCFSRE